MKSCVKSNQAPEKAPIIDREEGWCEGGFVTATTAECVCSTHVGNFCTGTWFILDFQNEFTVANSL